MSFPTHRSPKQGQKFFLRRDARCLPLRRASVQDLQYSLLHSLEGPLLLRKLFLKRDKPRSVFSGNNGPFLDDLRVRFFFRLSFRVLLYFKEFFFPFHPVLTSSFPYAFFSESCTFPPGMDIDCQIFPRAITPCPSS